jgi:hypothetical protein
MSLIIIGTVTLLYWSLLFVRMRARGRRDFDRAFADAAAKHTTGESFDVNVPIAVNPLRTASLVLGPPVVLTVIISSRAAAQGDVIRYKNLDQTPHANARRARCLRNAAADGRQPLFVHRSRGYRPTRPPGGRL